MCAGKRKEKFFFAEILLKNSSVALFLDMPGIVCLAFLFLLENKILDSILGTFATHLYSCKLTANYMDWLYVGLGSGTNTNCRTYSICCC